MQLQSDSEWRRVEHRPLYINICLKVVCTTAGEHGGDTNNVGIIRKRKVDVAVNGDPTCKASVSTPVDAYAGEKQFTALELIRCGVTEVSPKVQDMVGGALRNETDVKPAQVMVTSLTQPVAVPFGVAPVTPTAAARICSNGRNGVGGTRLGSPLGAIC